MTLNEALRLVNSRPEGAVPAPPVFLVCGFEPLHLTTFLRAHAVEHLPGASVEILTGLFGDLTGNLQKAAQSSATAAAVILEWEDLDPRLGIRSGGGWTRQVQPDIERTCEDRLERIGELVERLAGRAVVAVAGPTLPLVPLGHTVDGQATSFELGLHRRIEAFLERIAGFSGVRILHPAWLLNASPLACRLDPKMALLAGFPYTVKHASVLAGGLLRLLFPTPPKKGLIVDLDDTLWSGIIGEAGVDGVSWSLEAHSQVHSLLQQMLTVLSDNGVLLAIASKNELALVEQGLARQDMIVPRESFFPVLASWGPKSAAVTEILRVWNIAASSVAFLDDNPLELSEVQSAHPEITTLQFRPKDPVSVWELLSQLRNLFGKTTISAEDGLRAASIRSGVEFQRAVLQEPTHFLETVEGRVTISYRKDPQDTRSLELINKTNQFNLNGVRVTESDWLALLQSGETIAVTVSYQDKFGALGKIAALLAAKEGPEIRITSWVMSCRAFSRKIEHHTLESLFRVFDAARLRFDFRATDRNQPLQQFFQEIGMDSDSAGGTLLSRDRFALSRQVLPHQVSELTL